MRQADDRPASRDTPYAVRAVVRLLDILDVLQDAGDGVSLSVLTDRVGLPKSSMFRYLSTLESRGYIGRNPATGKYRFVRSFLPSQSGHVQLMTARAGPLLEKIRDRFGETVNLGVLDGNRVAYLEIVESPKAMRLAARKGDRDPIHSTALGKAIASRLDAERVRAMLAAEGMPQLTTRTITRPDAFLEELAGVRDRGFALDNGENEQDGRCVAVPIPGSQAPAAISLSAPAARFSLDRVEEVAEALRGTARRISRELGARDE